MRRPGLEYLTRVVIRLLCVVRKRILGQTAEKCREANCNPREEELSTRSELSERRRFCLK